MVRDNLYKPYEIVLKDVLDSCSRPEHKHSFFELVYVLTGSGKHTINQSMVSYKAGQLFLLAPNDAHSFTMQTPTRLFFLRFNNNYLTDNPDTGNTLKELIGTLATAGHKPGCLICNQADKLITRSIIDALINEKNDSRPYHHELIRQYINTLLMIIARSLSLSMPDITDDTTVDMALDMLQYIRQNIYHPEKIRVENISKQFGLSETYLGRYFKKHTSDTLQQYIITYKLQLVENRLQHSNMRINEIAEELGFTDKSHLNRIFKKYKGLNPSAYRKQMLQPA